MKTTEANNTKILSATIFPLSWKINNVKYIYIYIYILVATAAAVQNGLNEEGWLNLIIHHVG